MLSQPLMLRKVVIGLLMSLANVGNRPSEVSFGDALRRRYAFKSVKIEVSLRQRARARTNYQAQLAKQTRTRGELSRKMDE